MEHSADLPSAFVLPRSGVVRRADMLGSGLTDGEIRRLRRTGEWRRIGPGLYQVGSPPDGLAPWEHEYARHRHLARETVRRTAGDPVISHRSAALLHGLPWWGQLPRAVEITRTGPHRPHRGARVHSRTATLPDEDIVVVEGLRVTSVARTIIDLGRTATFAGAVVVADAALRTGAVTTSELAEHLGRRRGIPGIRAASRVVAFADGRSESVGESRSRVILAEAGLTPLTPQHVITGAKGSAVARVDLAAVEHRVVGEFDGRVKYGRLVPAGSTAGDVVFAEKVREDAIRALGWSVVRWTWADLDRPDAMVARWAAAVARSGAEVSRVS